MYKLTSTDRDRWVEALRSGDFSQITGTLKGKRACAGSVGYCCLGVFESIQGREPATEVCNEAGDLDEGPQEVYDNFNLMMPDSQQQPTSGSTKYFSDIVTRLINMNDEERSFDEIADFLETIELPEQT